MTRRRTLLLPLLLLALAVPAASAYPLGAVGPATISKPAAQALPKLPRMLFPVVGPATLTDSFGDPRGSRSHAGEDIMSVRRALAIAVEAGTVKFWTSSANAGCMLYLHGKSGTTYLYIHLNNDLGKGNDNRGGCTPGVAWPKGLKSGQRVAAGEPIGFVGDSGDADGIEPHLHFEVHPRGKGAVDPYPALRKAPRLLFAARQGTTFTLALTGTVVATGAGDVELKLAQVRSWPGGRKVPHDATVKVSVPETAELDSTLVSAIAAPALTRLLQGTSVTVWTAPATVTLPAQRGAPGALSAKRVVLKG